MVKMLIFITFHELRQTVTFCGRYLASENVKSGLLVTRSVAVHHGNDLRLLVTETIYDLDRQQRSVIAVFLVYDHDRCWF